MKVKKWKLWAAGVSLAGGGAFWLHIENQNTLGDALDSQVAAVVEGREINRSIFEFEETTSIAGAIGKTLEATGSNFDDPERAAAAACFLGALSNADSASIKAGAEKYRIGISKDDPALFAEAQRTCENALFAVGKLTFSFPVDVITPSKG